MARDDQPGCDWRPEDEDSPVERPRLASAWPADRETSLAGVRDALATLRAHPPARPSGRTRPAPSRP